MILLALASLLNCLPVAVDGDTIHCGREKIRLLGIDTPEMTGHCRSGRRCVSGDPVLARDFLQVALTKGRPYIVRVGRDRYGRTLATVTVARRDMSCYQLRHRQAVYVRRWDNGRVVANKCPATVRRARVQ